MSKEWSTGVGLLQKLYGFDGSWSLELRLGPAFQKVGELTGNGAVVVDETAVKVSKSEEAL